MCAFDPTVGQCLQRGRMQRTACLRVCSAPPCVGLAVAYLLIVSGIWIDGEIFALSISLHPLRLQLLCKYFKNSSVDFSDFFSPLPVPENVRLVRPFPDVNLPVLRPESEVLFSQLNISTDTAAVFGKIATSCQR